MKDLWQFPLILGFMFKFPSLYEHMESLLTDNVEGYYRCTIHIISPINHVEAFLAFAIEKITLMSRCENCLFAFFLRHS